jgi:hypothetical protein
VSTVIVSLIGRDCSAAQTYERNDREGHDRGKRDERQGDRVKAKLG